MTRDVGGHRHTTRRRYPNTLSIAIENVEVGGCPAPGAERPDERSSGHRQPDLTPRDGLRGRFRVFGSIRGVYGP